MDLIAILAAMLLNASTGCDALKADVMRVGGQDYLISSWQCHDKNGKSHLWRTWLVRISPKTLPSKPLIPSRLTMATVLKPPKH